MASAKAAGREAKAADPDAKEAGRAPKAAGRDCAPAVYAVPILEAAFSVCVR